MLQRPKCITCTSEERQIRSQVRSFFGSHGANRFDSANNPNNERIHQRAGFYQTGNGGFRVYMVLSEAYCNVLPET